jgi:DNA-binding GntR family transcriptional regulator
MSDTKSLKLYAYETIKKKIIQCEYPPYALLNETLITEELKVSRTPIRDALGRLEQEQLIKILPKKGIQISGITGEKIQQIFEIRLILEPYIFKKFGKTIEDSVFQGFRDFFSLNTKDTTADKANQKDNEFHWAIINASNNPYVIQSYGLSFSQNMRVRILSSILGKDRIEISQKEHLLVSKFCCEKNWTQAVAALKTHILSSRETALSVIKKLNSSPILFLSLPR